MRQRERFRPDEPVPRPPGPEKERKPIDFSKYEDMEKEVLEHEEEEGE